MKYPHNSLSILIIGAFATTAFSQTAATRPIVMTPPAVQDGSNWSRAPLPAQRQFDDVKAPDGQAVDQTLPPNTPASNNELAGSAGRVAIFQPTGATGYAVATTTTTEPALTPTGRTTTTIYTAPAYAVATRTASTRPIVMTPPAVQDGSNASRAPLPAHRQFDDIKSADGQAVDQTLPPNTPATNNELAGSTPRTRIMEPAAPAYATTTTTITEPALAPTGRSTVAVSTGLDATTVAQSIRSATMSNRDQVISDIESRMSASDRIMSTMQGTTSQLSAEVKDKANALKKSINNARKNWDSAREQLAADYEAYAAALARVDAANGVTR